MNQTKGWYDVHSLSLGSFLQISHSRLVSRIAATVFVFQFSQQLMTVPRKTSRHE